MHLENDITTYDRDDEFPILEFHPDAPWMPPMDDIEILALSIKTCGLQNPIVLRDGMVWAGRNRYRACRLLYKRGEGNYLKTRHWSGDESLAEGLAITDDVLRRHLTPSQRALIGANTPREILAQICAEHWNDCEGGRHRELVSAVFSVSTGLVDAASKVMKGPISLSTSVLDKRLPVSFAAKLLDDHSNDEIDDAIDAVEQAMGITSPGEVVLSAEQRTEFRTALQKSLAELRVRSAVAAPACDLPQGEAATTEQFPAASEPESVLDEALQVDDSADSARTTPNSGNVGQADDMAAANEAEVTPKTVSLQSLTDEHDQESVHSLFDDDTEKLLLQWPKIAAFMAKTVQPWYRQIINTEAGILLKQHLERIDVEFVCRSLAEDMPTQKCVWCHIGKGENESHICEACYGRKWVTAKEYVNWDDRYSAKYVAGFSGQPGPCTSEVQSDSSEHMGSKA